jgi:drug/metabolite transporter (DMT)-like permease
MILLPLVAGSMVSLIKAFPRHLGYLALTAFLGITMCNTLLYVAAETSSALNLSLIAIFSPAFTILFARLFLRDALTMLRIAGLTAATVGVILLITKGQVHRLAGMTFSV